MADQQTMARTTLRDPLDRGAIEAIVTGRHGAPFDVLGPHVLLVEGAPVWIVRAFLPGAMEVWLAPQTTEREGSDGASPQPLRMRALHQAGLYSVVAPGGAAPPYQLRVRWESG